jgi:ubiquinone/menaquinone biosynthesis C-methylase UbiE
MGERGDLWHRAIIDPTLLRVVGSVKGLAVLDLACGNGYLSRRFARQGAVRAVGIESSRPTLAFARRRERAHPSGAEFLERDAGNLRGLADGSFDLVVSNMALQDIQYAEEAVQEVARVLRPDGRFVFSLSHPCFDLDERSGWVVERVREAEGTWHDLVWRKVRAYREERAVLVPWDVSGTETGYTTSYHRTLTTYSRLLRNAGLAITRLEEPSPLPEAVRRSPQGPYIQEIPLHLVVEARPFPKLGRRSRPRPARRRESRSSARSSRKGSRRSGSGARTRGSGSRGRGSRSGL